jgi:predicted transcriptional regulator with HTH domain
MSTTRFSTAVSFTATSGVFLTVDPTGDDVGRTSDSRSDPNRFRGAVQGTGAAFHAAVFIHYPRLFIIHDKNPMRAYDGAAAATNTAVFFVDQRGYAAKVSEILHCLSPEAVLDEMKLTIP